jgi:hypothetical protein
MLLYVLSKKFLATILCAFNIEFRAKLSNMCIHIASFIKCVAIFALDLDFLAILNMAE